MSTSKNFLDADPIRSGEFRERVKSYFNNLEQKITELKNDKILFLKAYDNARIQLESHFEEIMNNVREKKSDMMNELKSEFDLVASTFDMALKQAIEVKSSLQKESMDHDTLVDEATRTSTNGGGGSEETTTLEDADAIMLNASTNEFAEETANAQHQQQLSERIERSFKQIEAFIAEDNKLMIDALLGELNTNAITQNYLKLVKCAPDFSGKSST